MILESCSSSSVLGASLVEEDVSVHDKSTHLNKHDVYNETAPHSEA